MSINDLYGPAQVWLRDMGNQEEGSRADVLVVNPRNTRFPLKFGTGEPMPEHLRNRIVHGLMQRYPAME